MSGPLVELRGVQKRFRIAGRGRRERTVLDNIDLTVERGESVVILGRNGAGKSTLMKLIAGIHHPSAGQINVNGRIGALIELGAGFHSEHAALPNLRAAATLMGVADDELDRVVSEAVTFSGLQAHLDKPLKHFSSGMVVRLGFALVAAAEPELLISDEVLAVGDESFQNKCISWLESYLERGGTLLLVSHNIYHAHKLCSRGVWLHEGRIAAEGDVFEVAQTYLAYHEDRHDAASTTTPGDRPAVPEFELRTNGSGAVDQLAMGQPLEVVLGSDSAEPLLVRLVRLSGETLWTRLIDGRAEDQVPVPVSALLPGRYAVELLSSTHQAGIGRRRLFRVDGRSREFGSFRLNHRWT